MKYTVLLFTFLLLVTGCATREYYNVHKKSRDIETDKAKCVYLAESRVPLYRPLVTVNINEKMSSKERRQLEARQRQQNQQNEFKRNRHVRRLRDACLKSMGWRWRMVE